MASNARRHLDQHAGRSRPRANDIDLVLATHLHFDHAGGFTRRDASGRVAAARFRARNIVVRRGEWEGCDASSERNAAISPARRFRAASPPPA